MADGEIRVSAVFVYASDWKSGTASLPATAEWVLLQIALHNWDKGEPVHERIVPMLLLRHPGGEAGWRADLDLLLEYGKLHRTSAGGLFSRRALAEYTKSEALVAKKKRAGARGAQKRWGNSGFDSSANGSANAELMRSQCDGNANKNKNHNQREDKSSPPYSPPGSEDGPIGDLIFSVDPAAFAAFKSHRIEIGKPLTAPAEKRLLSKLEAIWNKQGHDPAAVLQQSIDECWVGVFPLSDDRRSGGKKSGWRFDR